MKERILSGWHLMRIIRLALGLFIVGQGIVTKDWTFALLGSAFIIMPVLNMGCCGPSGCGIPAPRTQQKIEDISYEEVH